MVGSHLFYYMLIAGYLGLCAVYFDHHRLLFNISILFQVTPAILLIYSISRVRTLIKRLNSAAISVREWLMSLHTGIFAFYILISLTNSMLVHMTY